MLHGYKKIIQPNLPVRPITFSFALKKTFLLLAWCSITGWHHIIASSVILNSTAFIRHLQLSLCCIHMSVETTDVWFFICCTTLYITWKKQNTWPSHYEKVKAGKDFCVTHRVSSFPFSFHSLNHNSLWFSRSCDISTSLDQLGLGIDQWYKKKRENLSVSFVCTNVDKAKHCQHHQMLINLEGNYLMAN